MPPRPRLPCRTRDRGTSKKFFLPRGMSLSPRGMSLSPRGMSLSPRGMSLFFFGVLCSVQYVGLLSGGISIYGFPRKMSLAERDLSRGRICWERVSFAQQPAPWWLFRFPVRPVYRENIGILRWCPVACRRVDCLDLPRGRQSFFFSVEVLCVK